MPNHCAEIVSTYLASLQEEFHLDTHPSGCVIVTPFVRPDGDLIEILVEERPDGLVLLTDMGDTLAYLHLSGLSLSRRLLDDARRISHRFGAEIRVNELVTEADNSGLGRALHDLVQAAVSIAALVEKRRPYANLRFDEEVEATIIAQGRRYDSDYSVAGNREHHRVRYHINSGLNLLVQPFSHASLAPARSACERWFYRFTDILGAGRSWTIYALLDDRGERQSIWAEPSVTRPLAGLVHMIKWSEKERFIAAIQRVRDEG